MTVCVHEDANSRKNKKDPRGSTMAKYVVKRAYPFEEIKQFRKNRLYYCSCFRSKVHKSPADSFHLVSKARGAVCSVLDCSC